MKKGYTYDVVRYTDGGYLRKVESYEFNEHLIWDGLGEWWRHDQFRVSIGTYGHGRQNGVSVYFKID